LNFRVIKESQGTGARLGKLEVNGKQVETPILFHGTILNGKPEPWIFFKKKHIDLNIRGLMINAYEILKNKNFKRKVLDKGIHNYLKFDGIIFMDSGGYLIQKNQNFEIKIDDVIEIYKQLSPELIVSLDYPLSPTLNLQKQNENLEKTLKNYEIMSKVFPNIMPVIHGYTKKQIRHSCDVISSYEPSLIGIGSLVPLMRSTKGTKKIVEANGFYQNQRYSSKHFVIDAIKYVREYFPKSFLHVFGIGSASTMHLMFSLGVDSIDSMGWRLKAAYGAVQIPYTADRFLTSRNGQRKNRVIFSEKEKEIFNSCNCGIHKDYSYKEIDSKFELRAIHNAYVFLQENLYAIKEIRNDTYFNFVKRRLEKTVYFSLFKYSFKKGSLQTKLEF